MMSGDRSSSEAAKAMSVPARSFGGGGTSSGSPSMYELGGRQYLLVTAGAVGPQRGGSGTNVSASSGPTGIVAFALPQ